MFDKSFVLAISLFAVVCLSGLSGCSTTPISSDNYTSKYNYAKVANLPADYPTVYLPNGNLWDDFRKHTQLPLNLNNRLVQYQIRWYLSHQDFLNRSLTRGAQYFYYIYQQTKQRNLPAELALIPVFESGYVPIGRSNKGAVGLWQFMPRTAAGFKIRMNRWYDGRRDVVVSSDTALKYLTYLYYYFDKDWFLAIAAYNWGPGSVQNAVLRNQRHGYKADYWSLRMPQATRDYIPQLLALAAIIQDPGKYGIKIVPINNASYFERIDVGKQMSLDKVSKMSGASEWTMRMLNAGLLRGVTEPDGPYVVTLPHSKIAAFKDNLSGRVTVLPPTNTNVSHDAAVVPSAKPAVPVNATQEQKGNATQINSADHVSALAAAAAEEHKNIVVPSKKNAADDDLTNGDNVVSKRANITDDESSDDDDTPLPKAKAMTNKTKKGVSKKTQIHSNSQASANTKQYIVGSGETLFSIGRQYDIPVATLRRMNKLKNNSIKPGQILLIPLRRTSSTASAPANNETANVAGKVGVTKNVNVSKKTYSVNNKQTSFSAVAKAGQKTGASSSSSKSKSTKKNRKHIETFNNV